MPCMCVSVSNVRRPAVRASARTLCSCVRSVVGDLTYLTYKADTTPRFLKCAVFFAKQRFPHFHKCRRRQQVCHKLAHTRSKTSFSGGAHEVLPLVRRST